MNICTYYHMHSNLYATLYGTLINCCKSRAAYDFFLTTKMGGGAEKVLAMLKGGGTKSFGVVIKR